MSQLQENLMKALAGIMAFLTACIGWLAGAPWSKAWPAALELWLPSPPDAAYDLAAAEVQAETAEPMEPLASAVRPITADVAIAFCYNDLDDLVGYDGRHAARTMLLRDVQLPIKSWTREAIEDVVQGRVPFPYSEDDGPDWVLTPAFSG